jgi:uncharacterized Zn-finger protein
LIIIIFKKFNLPPKKMSEKQFVCTFIGCKKSFNAKKTLQNHTSSHAGYAKAKKTDNASFICRYCQEPFTEETNMYRHIREKCKKVSKAKEEEALYTINPPDNKGASK